MAMFFGMLSRLARIRITLGYAAALVAVSTALLVLGPKVQARVIRHVSTNLHNLAHGKLETLFGSAFVLDTGPVYVWLPGLLCLLALAELLWHSSRLTVVFLVGHIGSTLVVALGLVAAIDFGWLPASVSHASDVGMSYGAVAVLGCLTAAISSRWRPAWIGWWLSVAVTTAAVGGDFTDAGHSVALLLGMLVATRFRRPAHWTRVRYAMLTVAALFGFLLLAHTGPTVLAAIPAGAVGALAAYGIARLLAARRAPAAAAAAPVQPAMTS